MPTIDPATFSSARRLLPLTLAVAVGAGVLWWLLPRVDEPPPTSSVLVWVLLGAGFALSELTQLHIEVRRQTMSMSLSEVPLVLGLFLVDPLALLAARLAGALLVELWRRTEFAKTAFNLALFAFEIAAATAAFALLGGSRDSSPGQWLAAYGATIVVAVLTSLLVCLAVVRLQGRLATQDIVLMLVPLLAGAVVSTTGALLALVVGDADVRAVPLLFVLLLLAVVAYRAYSTLLRRHRTVGQMAEYTAAMAAGASTLVLCDQLLAHACTLLSAERGRLVLDASEHRPLVVRSRGAQPVARAGDVPDIDSTEEGGALAAQVRRSGQGVFVPRGTRQPAQLAWLAEQGLRDAVLVPLVGANGELLGTLHVGQRQGEMGTFGSPELELLQIVARHFSVAVSSRDLVDRLSHDAHHDPLTGLANRVLFHSRLSGAVLQRRQADRHAVLMLDLDGFKDVNDTLGHHSGDVMLQEVARRLTRSLPEQVTVARLGGDEFALLVPVSDDPDDTVLVAGLVQRALRAPFDIDGVDLEIRASVGVARCPQDSTDADVLLQRADIAMYAAKLAREPVRMYDPGLDRSSPQRLALVSELRTAIETGQLVCHYQPQLTLDGATVLGAEALVRWMHPRLGMIAPDEFIPMAEHTGLIVPLTSLVLRTALIDCARWRARGHDLHVAVNVSPRGLLAPHFAREVSTLLGVTGMPAGALTLEVTETIFMNDPARATEVLSRLHELGVYLSVDDFGTGYSSLAYLQRLPVDEVKIDKSFVQAMASDPADTAIVRSIVELGHNLGLTVVAEGVEDQSSLELLERLGCDGAQGFLLSRPLPGEVFDAYLTSSGGTRHAASGVHRKRRLIAVR